MYGRAARQRALDDANALRRDEARALGERLRAAAREQRQPDCDEARLLFNMDVLTWQKPRNVFVFWSYKTAEGAWHAEVTEAPFKGLCA